jgi:hypothetical protein
MPFLPVGAGQSRFFQGRGDAKSLGWAAKWKGGVAVIAAALRGQV